MVMMMTKLPPLSVLLAPHHGHADHLRAPSSSYYRMPGASATTVDDQRRATPLYSYAYSQPQQQQHKVYTSPASPSSPSWGPPFAQQRQAHLSSPPPSFHSQYQQEPRYPLNGAAYQSSEVVVQQGVHMASSPSAQFQSRGASVETASVSTVLQCKATTTQSAKTASTTGVRRPKASRYLREMDRRAIIKRLDDGEKQCALAKEFNVSRSSICNLFKHRAEVLGRAHHLSPFSKHPKKKCKKNLNALRQHSISSSTSSSAVGSSTASIFV
ncbi:hypothetical protein Gpo141_00010151 [Globisporangium polare]